MTVDGAPAAPQSRVAVILSPVCRSLIAIERSWSRAVRGREHARRWRQGLAMTFDSTKIGRLARAGIGECSERAFCLARRFGFDDPLRRAGVHLFDIVVFGLPVRLLGDLWRSGKRRLFWGVASGAVVLQAAAFASIFYR